MRDGLLLLGEVCCDEEECVDDEDDAGDDAEGAEGEPGVPVEGGLKPRQQCASQMPIHTLHQATFILEFFPFLG